MTITVTVRPDPKEISKLEGEFYFIDKERKIEKVILYEVGGLNFLPSESAPLKMKFYDETRLYCSFDGRNWAPPNDSLLPAEERVLSGIFQAGQKKALEVFQKNASRIDVSDIPAANAPGMAITDAWEVISSRTKEGEVFLTVDLKLIEKQCDINKFFKLLS